MSFFFLCVGLKLRFSEVDRPSLPPFLQIVRAYRSVLSPDSLRALRPAPKVQRGNHVFAQLVFVREQDL